MPDRRDVIRMGVSVLTLAGVAHAAEQSPETAGESSNGAAALSKAIADCVVTGNACLEHCLKALGNGDTTLAECATNVRDMLAVCAATQTLITGSSARTKAGVQLCLDVCADCERACRKHESHHAICKRCAEACAAVVKVARGFLA